MILTHFLVPVSLYDTPEPNFQMIFFKAVTGVQVSAFYPSSGHYKFFQTQKHSRLLPMVVFGFWIFFNQCKESFLVSILLIRSSYLDLKW